VYNFLTWVMLVDPMVAKDCDVQAHETAVLELLLLAASWALQFWPVNGGHLFF
jgi:hypothetical protein